MNLRSGAGMKPSTKISIAIVLLAWLSAIGFSNAQQTTAKTAASNAGKLPASTNQKASKGKSDTSPTNVLPPEEWKRVDAAVERALNWMAAKQLDSGEFPTLVRGQPGVTSLCMMAFLSHGHMPKAGPYGRRLERAADYVIGCQKENGLISIVGLDGPKVIPETPSGLGVNAAYNHAISALLLSELYGMGGAPNAERMKKAVKKALAVSLEMQRWPKKKEINKGGWRYLDHHELDSDLSVTGWELMFLRSARNSGFEVPKDAIDGAVAYVHRCYSKKYGTFQYSTDPSDNGSRGMAGAGILALAHAGYHNSTEARDTAEWILKQKFEPYNTVAPFHIDGDHYHFGIFSCCQGMYQLGGRYWKEFFPRIVPVLLANQQADGSWPPDSQKWDAPYGSPYTTALVVMTLGAPNQLLPIFQR
jgi:hypothetical protein